MRAQALEIVAAERAELQQRAALLEAEAAALSPQAERAQELERHVSELRSQARAHAWRPLGLQGSLWGWGPGGWRTARAGGVCAEGVERCMRPEP